MKVFCSIKISYRCETGAVTSMRCGGAKEI